ncbi:MAG: MFS transporter, partial [Caulobacteraceae bacterium]|nr:MFS transporter [Caulobacter sp.]
VVLRGLAGLVLAGAPAVAMAYVADELDPEAAGLAMGLYIAGTALGGMLGRLGCGALADLVGWRWAVAAVGAAGATAAALFHWSLPPSRRHRPARAESLAARLQGFAAPFRDPGLPWLFAEGGLAMGAFVTVYNYLAFRLLAPPYDLGQSAVAAVFALYLVGMVSSPLFGEAAGRLGRRRVLWAPMVIMLAGVGLTVLQPLGLVVAGVGLLTFGFFGAHSIASSWVGRRSGAHKAAAASIYLLVYYVGSSVAGSVGGVFWARAGWPGVAAFSAALVGLALVGAARLAVLKPLP